jgi:hypothetical protein
MHMKLLGPIYPCDGRTYCANTDGCLAYYKHKWVELVDCKTGASLGTQLLAECGCSYK